MKTLITFFFVVFAFHCLAQLNVLTVTVNTPPITTNASFERIDIQNGATLNITNNATVTVVNTQQHVNDNNAGKVVLHTNSNIIVTEGATLNVSHTGSYLGEILLNATAGNNTYIYNGGTITAKAINNEINNSLYIYDYRVAGYMCVGTIKVKSACNATELVIASHLRMTDALVSDNTYGFKNWVVCIYTEGLFEINPVTQSQIHFDFTTGHTLIESGGQLDLNYAEFVLKGDFFVDGSIISDHSSVQLPTSGQNYMELVGDITSENSSIALDDVDIYGSVNLDSSSLYVNGQVDMQGSLNLDTSSLYVNGQLDMQGSLILDTSSLYVNGELDLQNSINMDTSLLYVNGQFDMYNSLNLDASSIYIKGQFDMYDNSLLLLCNSSLVNVMCTAQQFQGTLILHSGSIIEGNTASSITENGDRILVDCGAEFKTTANPTVSPIIRRNTIATGNWPGIFMYSDYLGLGYAYLFDNCDISGIDHFTIKGNGGTASPVNFTECSFHDMGELHIYNSGEYNLIGCSLEDMDRLYIDSYANCTVQPLLQEPPDDDISTTFNNLEHGVIIDYYSTFTSDGCTYMNCDSGAITAYLSVLNIGGSWNDLNHTVNELGTNTFLNNSGLSVISLFVDPFENQQSVIWRNIIGTASDPNSACGLNVESSNAYITTNWIPHNSGHGFIGKDDGAFTFSGNDLDDNGGAEFFSDYATMNQLRYHANEFWERTSQYNANPPSQVDYGIDVSEYSVLNKYFLVLVGTGTRPNVTTNAFNGYFFNSVPVNDQLRFYPDYASFTVDFKGANEIFSQAQLKYDSALYEEAEALFQQVISEYPSSSYATSSITYLFEISRKTEPDLINLIPYLTTIAVTDSSSLGKIAGEYLTRCYISEGNYEAAISRLEAVLIAPSNSLDSLYAAINEGYCYMKLAQESKSLPTQCNVRTRTINELQDFVSTLGNSYTGDTNHSSLKPSIYVTNYPNPFNPRTSITYNLPRKGFVKAGIYNVKGQLVKQLVNEQQNSDCHIVRWNGYNDSGKTVSSGMYFFKVSCDGLQTTKKLMLMK